MTKDQYMKKMLELKEREVLARERLADQVGLLANQFQYLDLHAKLIADAIETSGQYVGGSSEIAATTIGSAIEGLSS